MAANEQRLARVINALTMDQALEYKKQQDPLCWIEYNILDPISLPRRYATHIEDALLALLGDEA